LDEISDDPVVYNHMGLAYYELDDLERALEAYRQASRLAPTDPAPLTRIAEIHERTGQRHAAADALFSQADLYQQRQNWSQAIKGLQRAIELHPDHLAARLCLADILTQLDQPQRAIKEYLALARVLQKQGQVEKAFDQCRRVLELDARNEEARLLAEALRSGESLDAIEVGLSPHDEGGSPVDLVRGKALAELASIPFEDQPVTPVADSVSAREDGAAPTPARPTLSRSQIDALVAQAIDFQTRGLIDEAIAGYTRVIDAGVDRPAAHFNIGLLYQQRLRFEPAITEFEKAKTHPQYALASHFAVGECYKALGRIDEALEQFVQVLKIVDLGTVKREQADDLINLYDALADSYIAKGDRDKALDFTNSLVEFLSSKGWEDKARSARRRLDDMSDGSVMMSLAEILAAPNAEMMLTAMSLSQEYMKRGALTAATEVCYQAIESAPIYLPLHLRLAEIFAQDDRIEDAVAKYQMVADLYLVREEIRQAIGVHKRMLRLAPMDVVIRSRLIDQLISSGEIDQALEHYLHLSDAYYQLAQIPKALEKYAEAMRLAPRASDEEEWRLRLLRRMAEVHLRRANWQEALESYRQLVALSPGDERARIHLIDLNYRLGQMKQADQETVTMVEYYRSRGEEARVLALLEEAVRLQPQQMALRARLARAYIGAGRREEAIRELDTLGELQLDAGLREQAMSTVRAIISLKPENVEAYQQLLAQL
jgi:tetratricopeptide (TPR) repeat protein